MPAEPSRPAASLTFFPSPVRLVIPSIELDSSVIEMASISETPKFVVGHYLGINPGRAGNVVLGGHNASFTRGEGDVFGRLEDVQLGDPIIVYTDNNWYLYKVTGWNVVPQTPEAFTTYVIKQTDEPVLTLFTCVPRWVWTHYLVVTASAYQL